jgi:hypothetical protein
MEELEKDYHEAQAKGDKSETTTGRWKIPITKPGDHGA